MIPIKEINIGDQFRDKYPFERLIYSVLDIDLKEKMVKVQAYDNKCNPIRKPFYIKNTRKLFSIENRIYNGMINNISY